MTLLTPRNVPDLIEPGIDINRPMKLLVLSRLLKRPAIVTTSPRIPISAGLLSSTARLLRPSESSKVDPVRPVDTRDCFFRRNAGQRRGLNRSRCASAF